MRYGSVCSGIEAPASAWHGLGATMCMTCEGLGRYNGHTCGPCKGRGQVGGWEPAWFSEIEPFPCAVLKHHYPDVPNLGDMTKYKEWPTDGRSAIDVLVGGTPCQSFSVAGLRKGLDDPRGNLMLTFGAIAGKYRPKWLVWENVPGVLSSNGGKDFGSFLGMLGQLGYGFAYRVLDAQYFGVAQRRRRVFVVGHLGDWRPAAAVLFERHSLQGNTPPSRKTGQGSPAGSASGVAVSHTIHPRVIGRDAGGPEGKPYRDGETSYTLDTTGGGGIVTGSHWDDPRNPHPTLNRGGMGGIAASNQEIFSQRGGGAGPRPRHTV